MTRARATVRTQSELQRGRCGDWIYGYLQEGTAVAVASTREAGVHHPDESGQASSLPSIADRGKHPTSAESLQKGRRPRPQTPPLNAGGDAQDEKNVSDEREHRRPYSLTCRTDH
jgi:hypothetical protein